MNSIQAKLDKSDYEGYFDYFNYWIDNFWLDEIIDKIYPDKCVKGNVPTLLYALEEEKDQKIVWDRILPKTGQTEICPILMCPDDCDFICTLIVAEIENSGTEITWKRIGIDFTKSIDSSEVGSNVEWFDKMNQMTFRLNEYEKMIGDFKVHYAHDKERFELIVNKIKST